MRVHVSGRIAGVATLGLSMVLVVGACSGSAAPSRALDVPPSSAATAAPSPSASASPSAAPTEAASPSAAASPLPTAQPSASPSSAATGPATLSGPATVEGGAGFQVAWTGPNAPTDYVTIVPAGASAWTDESFFYTSAGSPGTLVAPTEAGPYVLWYVSGNDDSVLARVAIAVTPFQGAFAAPASVVAGTPFKVGWKGPNGPQDYVTIVPRGAKRWTNESYFYTSNGNPGALVAPIKAGAYQLWYVTGRADKVKQRQAITVTPFTITLDAPDTVAPGSQFQVTWTGPNGPSDYITIVPAGSKVGTYASYAYTTTGNPVTITAPAEPGKYEIWYASDRVAGTFAKTPIEVK